MLPGPPCKPRDGRRNPIPSELEGERARTSARSTCSHGHGSQASRSCLSDYRSCSSRKRTGDEGRSPGPRANPRRHPVRSRGSGSPYCARCTGFRRVGHRSAFLGHFSGVSAPGSSLVLLVCSCGVSTGWQSSQRHPDFTCFRSATHSETVFPMTA